MVFSLRISYLMRNLGRGLQKVGFATFLLLSLVFRVIRLGFGAFEISFSCMVFSLGPHMSATEPMK